jgi:hypothetical protein
MEQTKVKTAVETFLPIFNGFYSGIWDSMIENDINEDIVSYREEMNNDKLTESDFDIDYSAIYKDLSKQIFDIISNDMKRKNLISGAKYEQLISPKYYNYSNDSINIEVYINEDNIDTIETILNENNDAWSDYIKFHFNGMFSHYSDNINNEDWNIREIVKNGYSQLGFVLDFILTKVYNITEETIYYDVELYTSEYIELNND